MIEVLNQASHYVQQCEINELEVLATLRDHWQHRAEGCGCSQCKKIADRHDSNYEVEFWRMFNNGVDQEEEWVVDQVWHKLGGNHGD